MILTPQLTSLVSRQSPILPIILSEVQHWRFPIDGGLGVAKNVTVGGNLNVQGYAEFVSVTFKGGTINLGDADTDDINVVVNLFPVSFQMMMTVMTWANLVKSGEIFTLMELQILTLCLPILQLYR